MVLKKVDLVKIAIELDSKLGTTEGRLWAMSKQDLWRYIFAIAKGKGVEVVTKKGSLTAIYPASGIMVVKAESGEETECYLLSENTISKIVNKASKIKEIEVTGTTVSSMFLTKGVKIVI